MRTPPAPIACEGAALASRAECGCLLLAVAAWAAFAALAARVGGVGLADRLVGGGVAL